MVNPVRDVGSGSNKLGISNGVNVRERVFFISGTNFSQRRQAAESIKKRILKGKNRPLNVLTFYAKETDAKDLGEKLFTASFGKDKIAVFKNSQDLPAPVKNFLFNNLEKILSANYLIFETDKDYYQLQRDKRFTADKFFNSVLKRAALFRAASSKPEAKVEDFIGSLRKDDLASALYVLEQLFKGGSQDRGLGPQIMGILVRKFSFLKDPVEKDRCFKYLWEADRAIKEKGLDPRLVIETLLVKVFKTH